MKVLVILASALVVLTFAGCRDTSPQGPQDRPQVPQLSEQEAIARCAAYLGARGPQVRPQTSYGFERHIKPLGKVWILDGAYSYTHLQGSRSKRVTSTGEYICTVKQNRDVVRVFAPPFVCESHAAALPVGRCA